MFCLHCAWRWSNCRPKEDDPGQTALSSSSHNTARTGTIAGSVVVNASIRPPPPLKRWSARLVHREQAPDQRFRARTEVEDRGFSRLFLGTYSALPYAAPCRVAPRTRPVRCYFAVESSVEVTMHRAAQGMSYATALLSLWAAFTVGRKDKPVDYPS